MDVKTLSVKDVLKNVEMYLERYENGETFTIPQVYNDLNIFDWFNDSFSKRKLQTMRAFLKASIKFGYTGYCCFKVGSRGTANGMWAYKQKSTTGYSPDGEFIYRSFTPDYIEWAMIDADGNNLTGENEDETTFKTWKDMYACARRKEWI